MPDGSTTRAEPAPFAVGYGNGYGYESLPPDAAAAATPTVDRSAPTSSTVDPRATLAVTRVDLESALAAARLTPVVDEAHLAPFTARPAGSAHPRRRFGRGLLLTSVALLATAAGIGIVVLAWGAVVGPGLGLTEP